MRKYISTDAHVISTWITDSRFLLQWAGPGFTYPITPEQFGSLENDERINAFTLEDGVSISGYGEIVVFSERQGRVCRVIVAESVRGTGVGRQLIKMLVEAAFTKLTLDILTLNVFDFNESAIRCYESVGFKETDRLEAARDFESEKWDLVVLELRNSVP